MVQQAFLEPNEDGPSDSRRDPHTSSRPEPEEFLDLNTATVDELWELPGIGRTLSGRIVESRIMDGAFTEVWDLLRVPGISPRVIARILNRVAVDGRPARPRPSLIPAPPVSEEVLALNNRAALSTVPKRSRELARRSVPAPASVPTFQSVRPSVHPAARPSVRPSMRALPSLVSAPPPSTDGDLDAERSETTVASAAPDPRGRSTPPADLDETPRPAVVEARPADETPPARAVTAAKQAPAAPPRSSGQTWIRTIGIAAVCAGVATLGYAALGVDRSAPKPPESTVQTDKLSTELSRVQADQEKTRNKVDLFAEVASQFPQTTARLDALSHSSEAQRKDVAEAQASVQRLNREVNQLRDALYKSQRDSERRVAAVRAEIESRIQSTNKVAREPAADSTPRDKKSP